MNNNIDQLFIENFDAFALNTSEILFNNKYFKQQEQLYHYTSIEAIEAMINTQSLRATSIYMMNDPNELIYGQDQICNWFNNNISEQLKLAYKDNSFNNFSAFVFSLTELSDDMNQWDKYGNKHKGIRIGFTPKNIIEYWSKIEGISVFLVPVIYHDSNSKYMEPYGKPFLNFKTGMVTAINNLYINKEIEYHELQKIKFYTSIIASMIKRKEWASEKEWRVVCISGGPYHKNIIGEFQNGKAIVKLENKTPDTLKMFTKLGHGGVASKDVLKVGCNAGNKEQIQYVLSLLSKLKLLLQISQSTIQTRY